MRSNRALWVALLALGVVAGAFHLRHNDAEAAWLPPCAFYETTGLHCAGCGMTRASHAALNGRFAEALSHNPLGIILLPLVLLAVALEAAAWMLGHPGGPRVRIGMRGMWVLVAMVLGYWLLRNIPYWPFTLLAPGA